MNIVSADRSNSGLDIRWLRLPTATMPMKETIYGREGALTWTVDGDAIEVGSGQALCIPRGVVHQFANHGSEDAKALVVVSPAAIGPEYFREIAEVVDTAAGGPPDRARLMAIMRRHGLTPAPPPSA